MGPKGDPAPATPVIDVCVVGAGIAGLTAAGELAARGLDAVVLEKSRGLGGRAATRRVGTNRADHGAQHVTVRDERFRHRIEAWAAEGRVAEWSRGFHHLRDGRLEAPSDGHPRYALPEGMNTLGKLLAEGIEVRRRTRATAVRRIGGGWRVELEGGDPLTAHRVVIAIPAGQARELLADTPLPDGVASALDAVAFDPCWAVIAGYPPEAAPPWRGVQVEGDPVVAWVAHDSGKRTDPEETVLVLHSTPELAHAFGRDRPDEAAPRLLAAAAEALGGWIEAPRWRDHQRWRYALARTPHPEACLPAGEGLVLAGDWCGGARVEAAYLSGLAAAATLT